MSPPPCKLTGIYEFTGGKLIRPTVSPAPEPPFNGAELGMLAHLYRDGMYRSKVWRTRLDATINWAVANGEVVLAIGVLFHAGLVALALLTLKGHRAVGRVERPADYKDPPANLRTARRVLKRVASYSKKAV